MVPIYKSEVFHKQKIKNKKQNLTKKTCIVGQRDFIWKKMVNNLESNKILLEKVTE